MVSVASLGRTPSGRPVRAYTLSAGEARVRVTDFGATLLGAVVPDKDGRLADVLLGYGSLDGYLGEDAACYGATIGPVANRTDRAELAVGGRTYHLPRNDGPSRENNLHTDLESGLHRRVWDACADESSNAVRLVTRLVDGELGLPGNRTFGATFSLVDGGGGAVRLSISYSCTTDAPTFVNMTNHSYFNLAGHDSGSALNQLVRVEADEFLPIRGDSVSTGEIRTVSDTPFDFREPKALGEDISRECEQLRRARGYDHCFCIRGFEDGAAPRPALAAMDPASGRTLEVRITAPGAHLYTGNWLDDAHAKDDCTYHLHAGFAFEPEFYPDCAHHPEWPQPVCVPGHPYASTIVWCFGTAGHGRRSRGQQVVPPVTGRQ